MKELSIEDKAKRYDEVLRNAKMFYKDEHVSDDVNNLLEALFPELDEIDWLKSLKNRVQPKQEWSEEDERKLELLKALIKDAKGDATFYSTMFREMEELNNWLKTLKDRVGCEANCTTTKEWKPSDEQLTELRKYSDNVILRNLYYSLKKLKE